MIPHDAQPIGLKRVAEILGLALGTMSNAPRPHRQPGFPPQLNPGGRTGIWDERQVQAFTSGEPVPVLVTDDAALDPADRHPDDRLDDREAATAAGVALATWRTYAADGHTGAQQVDVCGVRYWLRGTVRRRHDTPPGERGRPVGATDHAPRRKRATGK